VDLDHGAGVHQGDQHSVSHGHSLPPAAPIDRGGRSYGQHVDQHGAAGRLLNQTDAAAGEQVAAGGAADDPSLQIGNLPMTDKGSSAGRALKGSRDEGMVDLSWSQRPQSLPDAVLGRGG